MKSISKEVHPVPCVAGDKAANGARPATLSIDPTKTVNSIDEKV